jgi:SpoVK/Ycf46/Vps4 family AAA+-type ATPase
MKPTPRLDQLAERLEPRGRPGELRLPEAEQAELRSIAGHVVQARALEKGDPAHRSGLPVLFTGASGTGKRLAAEALAAELGSDLYRVDLSGVVSKYVGETEAHLGRLFDAAEAGGAILLFEEAEALRGKRSEVEDSHDRYANIGVSYLLKRMEACRCLAILTTNRSDWLDAAFLRRLRFVVRFPFPPDPREARSEG